MARWLWYHTCGGSYYGGHENQTVKVVTPKAETPKATSTSKPKEVKKEVEKPKTPTKPVAKPVATSSTKQKTKEQTNKTKAKDTKGKQDDKKATGKNDNKNTKQQDAKLNANNKHATDKSKQTTANKKTSPTATKTKVTYRIQVGAGKAQIDTKDAQFKGLNVTRVKEGSMNKYFYGTYHSYADAQKALKTVRAKVSAAYIVAYVGGKAVSVAEARSKE